MERVNQFLGIMLTVFMLGSSSGIASFADTVPPDPASDSNIAALESGETNGDLSELDDSGQREALPEQPVQPAVAAAEPTLKPVDQVAADEPVPDANLTTGPPAGSHAVEAVPAAVDEQPTPEPAPSTMNVEPTVVVQEGGPEKAPIPTESALELDAQDESDGISTANAGEETSATAGVETQEATIVPVVDSDNIADRDRDTANSGLTSMNMQATSVSYTFVVLDWDDNLIDGATVSVTDYEGDVFFGTITTVNGQATFSLEPGDYMAHVSATGYWDEDTVYFTVYEGDESDSHNIRLNVKKDGTFTVQVLNWDTDKPVSGATVAITDIDNISLDSGTTNGDGVFTSKVLPAGTIYFEVSHPDFEPSIGSSMWIEGNSTYPGGYFLTPITGGTITFTAMDAMSDDDTPLANVSVQIESWGTNGTFNGTTDANGKATFADLPGGEYTVTANLAGYQEREQKLHVRGDADERLPMYPIVEQPGKLTLNIFEYGSGDTVAGVDVVILDANGNEVDRGTSVDNQFVSQELPFGTYTALLTKDGYHDEETTYLTINGDLAYSVHIREVQTGTATIQVLDVTTDAPIAGAKVIVSHDDIASDLVLTTDSNGLVDFPATSFGYYSIDVSKEGYATNSFTIDFEGDNTFTTHLRALQPGSAIITVRDMESNSLLAGVNVQVQDWDTGDVLFEETTTVSGTVTTQKLPEDGYRIVLSRDGYFTVDTLMPVRGDVDHTYHLETIKPGVITVQALSPTNVTIAGANVLITEAIADGIVYEGGGIRVKYIPGATVHSGTTDANGRVESGTLESGSYLVFISADGYELYSRVVHLNGDQVVATNLIVGTSTPIDPTNPQVPPDPNAPTDPTDPTNPSYPTNPANPTDPATPSNPSNPTTPTDPVGDGDTDGQDNEDQTRQTNTLKVSFFLCADEKCDATSSEYDGYTVSWTVTPLDTEATQEIEKVKMAAVGMAGSPVNSSMMQASQSFVVTGVLQNGVATGVSEPLLLGRYNVCLNAEITGPGGEVVRIADQATCADLTLGADGSTMLPFGGIDGSAVVGDPVVTPEDQGEGKLPTTGDLSGTGFSKTVAQSGVSDPTGSAVTSLPNTGVGTEAGAKGWLAPIMVLMLLFASVVLGSRRSGRRG